MQATQNNRGIWIAVAGLVLLLLALPFLGGGMMRSGWMGPGGMWGFGSSEVGWSAALTMGLGMFSMVAFWVLLVAAIVLGVRWIGRIGQPTDRADTPIETLNRRFAAGELTADEYREMKRVLQDA